MHPRPTKHRESARGMARAALHTRSSPAGQSGRRQAPGAARSVWAGEGKEEAGLGGCETV